MSQPKIGVILSTTRAGRLADKVAPWFMDIAKKRTDLSFEIVDLRDFPMPFFDEAASNAYVPSTNVVAQKWQKKVAEFDGYVFLTAEYNNSIPAVLKNALDYAYPEWNRKAAAFFGYGSMGATRAIQHMKELAVELQMVPVRFGAFIQGGEFMGLMMGKKTMAEFDYLVPNVELMLEQLAWWTNTTKAARENG